MLYISYIINVFHRLYMICINCIFLFPAKIFLVQCLPLILYNYFFSLQIPPRLFSLPAFFLYFALIISTLPFLYNYFVLYLFHIQELVSHIKLCIYYQLSK